MLIGGTVVPPSDFQSKGNLNPYATTFPSILLRTRIRTRTNHHTLKITSMKRKKLYVLIACEESQAECIAFRELGHVAYSCDIQPCRKGGNPYWHIKGDVRPLLHGATAFNVQAGFLRCVPRWDLIITHPPCTYLTKVGSCHMYKEGTVDPDRFKLMQEARAFFFECLNAECEHIAVENPIPMAMANLPRPSFYACPSWYGVKYTKKTLYWVKNLPPLMPEIIYPNPKCYVSSSRGKYRSRTFPQMAKAIAQQWSEYILQEINNE